MISNDECRAIYSQLRDDIEAQRLASVGLDLDRVFTTASECARAYTAKLLTRSLDVLHVAAAQLTRCERFVSADDRQLALAKSIGLNVVISSVLAGAPECDASLQKPCEQVRQFRVRRVADPVSRRAS